MRDKDGKLIRDENKQPIYEKASMISIRVDSGLNKAWRA